MKSTLKLFVALALIVGFFGFSIYAHNAVEDDISSRLRENITALQTRNASLTEKLTAIRLEASTDKHRIYDTLVIIYPGDDDIQRLDALFWPVVEEDHSECGSENHSECDHEDAVSEVTEEKGD